MIADHPDIAEVAVIGIKDSLKGQIPFALFVINEKCDHTDKEIIDNIILMVRQRIGAFANFKYAVRVSNLPKTRSGKVVRKVMRAIACGEEYTIPPTIESLQVVKDIEMIINQWSSKLKE